MKLTYLFFIFFVTYITDCVISSRLKLIKTGLSRKQNKLIKQFMSFISKGEEVKRERETNYSREKKLTKIESRSYSPPSKPRNSEPPVRQKQIRENRIDNKLDRLNDKLSNLKEEKKETIRKINEDKQKLKERINNLESKKNRTRASKSKNTVTYTEGALYAQDDFMFAPQATVVSSVGSFGAIAPVPVVRTYDVAPVNTVVYETKPDYVLREMPLDQSHSLNYYYPYFYKTQILRSYSSLDYSSLKTACPDRNCKYCNAVTNRCEECFLGHFLFNGNCLNQCEAGYIANNYKRTCNDVSTISVNVGAPRVYVKAFTTGSCRNMCGRQLSDCSCHSSCQLAGSCCSDYDDCSTYVTVSATVSGGCSDVPNCQLCDMKNNRCAQCESNFFLMGGKCVSNCGQANVRVFSTSHTCFNTQDCRVENCQECVPGNPAVCKQCFNGFFMFNNQCLNLCPVEYRADRATWTCQKQPVFAWYWVFPSRSSCQKRCGQIISQDNDCSCDGFCYRNGNCCQDIEDYCDLK